jgi:hypothetical protein
MGSELDWTRRIVWAAGARAPPRGGASFAAAGGGEISRVVGNGDAVRGVPVARGVREAGFSMLRIRRRRV